MIKGRFIGRKKELEQLERLTMKRSSSLVVITGRRRIGKSRLIQEFSKSSSYYAFSGLPPSTGVDDEEQRREFARSLVKQANLPDLKYDNWSDLFWFLADKTSKGKHVILLDEISWMAGDSKLFLGQLKNAWDLQFKQNPELILVLCGSVSAWIKRNILASTGFMGRVSLTLEVEQLSLQESNEFWGKKKNQISAHEKFKFLSMTGGVPRYLEELHPEESAEENMRRLAFSKSGILFNEFENIFSDLFMTESKLYISIVKELSKSNCDLTSLSQKLNIKSGGVLSQYLDELKQAGFITREFTWHIKNGKMSKLSKYRLSDNYLRFYLKYIEPNKSKIIRGAYEAISISSLPNWNIIMGLQFESLVLQNRQALLEKLNIKLEEVIIDNPYFQKSTQKAEGVQIDYLVQTRYNTLYICEIKFYKDRVGASIIRDMQTKIDKLKIPKNYSVRPVLIHVNGVKDEVLDNGYFSNIIDFSDLLEA